MIELLIVELPLTLTTPEPCILSLKVTLDRLIVPSFVANRSSLNPSMFFMLLNVSVLPASILAPALSFPLISFPAPFAIRVESIPAIVPSADETSSSFTI